MKRHRIFNKGETIYCLLSSQSHPDILLPVKGFIVDTKWDRVNPKYKIKILKFHDSIQMLKKYYFEMRFSCEFDVKSLPIMLKADEYNSVPNLEQRIHGDGEARYYVIVDSIMCVKTLQQARELFSRIQFYIISKKYKEIREASARKFGRGAFTVDSLAEWDARFITAWGDKLLEGGIKPEKYIVSLN
jgi:hypothetical protein